MRHRRAVGSLVASLLTSSVLALIPPAAAAPPSNDAFSSAFALGPSLPANHSTNTSDATLEPGEPQPPCGFGQVAKTVWYSFSPSSDTIANADTLGTRFDTVVSVWTGSALNDLELVSCSDDFFTLAASATFRARAGTTYYIQVGGFGGRAGPLSFELREVDGGVIEGTVTEEQTGRPLRGVCVLTIDRDIGSEQFNRTRSDGTYDAVVRGGSYLVLFLDFCLRSDNHIAEWYDDVPFSRFTEATPVDVASSSVQSGIDAALVRGCPGIATLAELLGYDQVVGTRGPDLLAGTSGADAICGVGGADVISGRGGDDALFGGRGGDRLRGRGGDDFISGGAGSDLLRGGWGSDFLDGGRQRDRCVGGRGADVARRCEIVRGARAPVVNLHGSADRMLGGDLAYRRALTRTIADLRD